MHGSLASESREQGYSSIFLENQLENQARTCRLLCAAGLIFSQRNSHMMISLVVALTLASNNKGQPVDSPITQAKKMVLISIARMNWLIFSDTAPVLPER